MHVHEPVRTPAERAADPQDDARRRRDVRLRDRRSAHRSRRPRRRPRRASPRTPSPRRSSAPPGDYRITETLPRSTRGSWAFESAECGGDHPAQPSSIAVTAAIRQGDRLHVHQPLHADRQDPHPQADAARGRHDGVRDPARRDALAQVPAVGDDRARRPGGARDRRRHDGHRSRHLRRPGDDAERHRRRGVGACHRAMRRRARAVLAGSHQADADRGRPRLGLHVHQRA